MWSTRSRLTEVTRCSMKIVGVTVEVETELGIHLREFYVGPR